MIDLKCPSCKNVQKYSPSKNSKSVVGKKKKCVFCSRSFDVVKNKNSKKQVMKFEEFVPLKS